MNKRIGRFSLSRLTVECDTETAMAIMARCIVVRCELMYASNSFEYVAMSPEFEEVQQGEMIPAYDVIISDSGKTIEFKRKG